MNVYLDVFQVNIFLGLFLIADSGPLLRRCLNVKQLILSKIILGHPMQNLILNTVNNIPQTAWGSVAPAQLLGSALDGMGGGEQRSSIRLRTKASSPANARVSLRI